MRQTIIKTFALTPPKGFKFFGLIDDGKTIMFRTREGVAYMKIPKGKWKVLTIIEDVIHLLPKSEKAAIRKGFVTERHFEDGE